MASLIASRCGNWLHHATKKRAGPDSIKKQLTPSEIKKLGWGKDFEEAFKQRKEKRLSKTKQIPNNNDNDTKSMINKNDIS